LKIYSVNGYQYSSFNNLKIVRWFGERVKGLRIKVFSISPLTDSSGMDWE
jgi:hypothetical protein